MLADVREDPGEPDPAAEGDSDEDKRFEREYVGKVARGAPDADEERCRRDNQCMKNPRCVRGYKHGGGRCKIR